MTPLALLVLALKALKLLIFVDFVLSWIQQPGDFPRSLTMKITEPLYAPIRALIRPDQIGIDFSPMVFLILLQIAEAALFR